MAGMYAVLLSFSDDPYYTGPGVTVAGVHEWYPVTRHEALAGL
jgi:hypothetical protein